MTCTRSIIGGLVAAAWLATLVPVLHAQNWLDFAHPAAPHMDLTNPDVPMAVPALLQGPGDVTVTRPVLVVLMDWSDMTHRAVHDVPFWRDLVFGDPRPGIRPSVRQIYRANSNGRLLLVPATAGDTHDGTADGVVGWAASSQSSTVLTDPSKKRAEAIRVADPLFDYNVYDANGDGFITTDELVVIAVFADNAATGASCEQHIGHPNPPDCVNRPGGNTRPTDPRQVAVDQGSPDPVQVYQYVAGVGEMTHVEVVAHEIAHSSFGLGDLYSIDPAACSAYEEVVDGYYCNTTWYPPTPGVYSLMASYWVDFIMHLDPWAKLHLGFLKPLVVTHDGTYTLYDAETDRSFSTQDSQPEALIICDPLRAEPYKEYFIVENRNLAGLADHGLAVWLINEYTTDMRKRVRLVRRGGHWMPDEHALWDGVDEAQGYDWTASSVPRDSAWTDGTSSYVELNDIPVAGASMTVYVRMPSIFVDWASPWLPTGSQALPFQTVASAIAAIPTPPRTIRIAGGSYPDPLTISTPCTLMAWRDGTAVLGR